MVLLLGIFCLESCLVPGHYTSNPKSRAAFAGSEIILTRKKTFIKRSWTDNFSIRKDSEGNRIWDERKFIGYGTYVKKGKFLELTFLNEDSITVIIEKAEKPIANEYKLSVITESGTYYRPWVSLNTDSLKQVRLIPRPDGDVSEFEIKHESGISTIGFFAHSFQAPPIIINVKDVEEGENVFKFKTYNGHYSKGEKLMLYFKRKPTGVRYGPKKRWMPKKYKWKWLNQFHET